MGAEEAIAYGLIDKVISSAKETKIRVLRLRELL